MKNIFVKDIVRVCQGKLLYGNDDIACENFSRDSREIKEDDVYVGIKGDTFDGSKFYLDALEKGAKVCILQDIDIDLEKLKNYNDIAIVLVDDTILALQQIATYKRSLYNIPVVAVTGSVGKTSTKDIIASVMGEKYNVLKTEGNYNNHIGVPLTILRLKDHDALVVEMGMSALGEISVLTKIAKPTTCVITNVGTSHIGELGSRENILKAKLEILEGMEQGGTLIINNDNDMLNMWKKQNNVYKVMTFGIENESNLMAKNITLNADGSTFDVKINDKNYSVKVPVGGKHFVLNSLCALSVGIINGIEPEKIIEGIAKFELTKNRMDVEALPNGSIIINGAYNASFDSMKSSLEYLSNLSGRKIAVLGDMLELGEFSEELHRNVGKEVVNSNVDILFVCGKEAKFISDEARKNGMNNSNIFEYDELDKLIVELKNTIKKDDNILIKASHGMQFNNVVQELKRG